MIRFFAAWREKRKLKAAFADEYRTMVIKDAFCLLIEDFDANLRGLESSYIARGLTQHELDKVKKDIGYVRIE